MANIVNEVDHENVMEKKTKELIILTKKFGDSRIMEYPKTGFTIGEREDIDISVRDNFITVKNEKDLGLAKKLASMYGAHFNQKWTLKKDY